MSYSSKISMKKKTLTVDFFRHHGSIGGTIGGKKRSPAKTKAAKENIKKRWSKVKNKHDTT